MAYGRYGPFTDDEEPGMSAEFINPLEDFLVSVNSAATDSHITADGNGRIGASLTGTQISGQVSGTATLYQPQIGTIKEAIISFANYRNNAAQTITFPVAFTVRAYVQTTETNNDAIAFLNSGSAQTVKIITTLASTGGSQNGITSIKQWSMGLVDGPFDTIQIGTGASTAFNALIILKGI
jgi:hypothetical protein